MSSTKKNISFSLRTLLLFFLLLFTNCTEPDLLPNPSLLLPTVLYGQVYNLSHPGPIPVGWVPPPYDAVCRVIAEDVKKNIRLEVDTDGHGKFQFIVPPGVYYLRVKESYISSVTGPYTIREGEMLEAKAYFDIGMR